MPAPDNAFTNLLRTFTPFDWLIAAVAIYSVVRGLLRGLIRELFALAALLLGVLIAAWNYAPVATWLSRWMPNPAYVSIAAFLLLAITVTLAVLLLGRLVRSAAHLVGLGLLDRLAGACFGLARASLLGAALLMALTAFLPPLPAVRDSRLAPPLLRLAHAVSMVTPPGLQARLAAGIARLHGITPANP